MKSRPSAIHYQDLKTEYGVFCQTRAQSLRRGGEIRLTVDSRSVTCTRCLKALRPADKLSVGYLPVHPAPINWRGWGGGGVLPAYKTITFP